MIFQQGHSQTVVDALSFKDGVEIGNFRYVTGSGKNRRVHSYFYAKLTLKRPLPNIVVDCRRNNFFGMTNLPDVYSQSQKIRLEGDFSDNFDVYIPEGYGRDALYVLTPDVMQALLELGGKFDLEVVDDQLYMYHPVQVDLTRQKMLEPMLGMVGMVMDEIGTQAARYSDERIEDAASTTTVAAPEQRLKKAFNWKLLMLVTVFAVLQVAIFVLPNEYSTVVSLLMGVLIWSVVIFAVVSSLKRQR